MDMSSYFESFNGNSTPSSSECYLLELDSVKPVIPEEKMLLKVVMLALDDLTSRKKLHRRSALCFLKSPTLVYYLQLLGVSEPAIVRIMCYMSEMLGDFEEVGTEGLADEACDHDDAWFINQYDMEIPREQDPQGSSLNPRGQCAMIDMKIRHAQASIVRLIDPAVFNEPSWVAAAAG